MIRYLTAGESHGRCLVGILEGMPAGLAISADDIHRDLHRRQLGYGRGERMQIERDEARILSGVRYGVTLGSPLALLIENRDWSNWETRMRVDAPPGDERSEPLTAPRPGHADHVGALKYQHRDIRNVIERSSARETAMRVALGAVCRAFFAEFGVAAASHVVQIGAVKTVLDAHSLHPREIHKRADASPVRCLDARAEAEMMRVIDKAREAGDTVGGVFEVVVTGLPAGLGSYVQDDRRLDALVSAAAMSIPAIKVVEIGEGLDSAVRFGSEVHDQLYPDSVGGVMRKTNRAGGIEGGMSTGEPLRLRAAMKPLSTLGQPLETVDLATGEAVTALRERSDVCAVPAAAVVAEAMCLLALMNPFLEKFGGDSLQEIRNHAAASPASPWA